MERLQTFEAEDRWGQVVHEAVDIIEGIGHEVVDGKGGDHQPVDHEVRVEGDGRIQPPAIIMINPRDLRI